jgi:branched-chain amino acid transport system substrate-binding protein
MRSARTRLGLVVVLASLAATGCGSHLTNNEIRAANGLTGTASTTGADMTGTSGSGVPSPSGQGAGSTGGSSGPVGSAGTVGGSSGSGATGGTSGLPTPPLKGGKDIVLGNVGTYSGVVGNSLAGVRPAILAWAATVNRAGGIGGRRVKVITADDQNDPRRTLQLVKDMNEKDHVDAYIAMYAVMNTSSVRSYIEGSGIPVIGGDLIDDAWVSSPSFFPQGSSFESITAALAKMAANAGHKRIGIMYCIETPLCSSGTKYVESAAPRYGASVVYKSGISLGSPNYTAQCRSARRQNVDFLLIGADPATVKSIARDCSAQSFRPQYAAPSIAVTAALEHYSALEGFVSGQAHFPWMAKGTPALDAFRAGMARFAPGTLLSSGTAGAWTSGQLLLAASKHVKGELTRTSLFPALNSIRNDTLGGLTVPLTFREGARHPEPGMYFPIQIVNGVFTAPRGVTPQGL